ncbi:MAG: adenylate/guanylate cyclase [Magnetococcales bacterium]|nr:adenylate/guanylate cyclase [Magnetococcales bacterium]HIJ82580.1 CHASE2 domain-containing protein [Magnetococcales bacterium]
MNKILRRYDIFATILFFMLAIPAEYFEIFSLIEEQTISFRHILRQNYGDPELLRFPSDKIVLVNTDENFFKEYKSFPLRRTDVGKIAENLKMLGAKVVAIDLLMDFPSSYNEDQPTAESLKKAEPVLLVSQASIRGGKFEGLNQPTQELAAVTQNAYTNIGSQSGLVTSLSRLRVYPEIAEKAKTWPYAIKALAMFLGVEPELGSGVIRFGPDLAIPMDQFNNIYIDFPVLPPGSRFLSQTAGFSALDYLNLDGKDEEELYELSFPIKDRIVLLGDTSEVSHDWFDTPVGMVYGVEIIADVIQTMLKGGPLRPASVTHEVLVAMVLMLGMMVLGVIKHPTLRVLVAFLVICLWGAGVTMVYIKQGLVFSMSYALLAAVLSFVVTNMRFYLQEMSQKKMIKGAFGQYLSPKVVDILVKDPSKLSLGGEERVMTAYFSDVAGFSSISEKLTPSELVLLLNEYLTAMCEIIARYDGTVDKFEGDAIIAFWGAPLDQPDHATLCCHAAAEMQQFMAGMRERLVKEGRAELRVRMGINSGRMVVGNMGSKQRMDYTIMGDAVNLAARLEGANKFYASDTMISDATYQMAKDNIDCRVLDTVRVIGKKEPIPIYQLLGKKGQVTGKLADMLVHYNAGLERYKARDYKDAISHFEKALGVIPGDGPSKTYLDRCKEYLVNPPAADWDGVFVFTSKG